MFKPTTDATPVLFESSWWTRLAAISENRQKAIASQRRKRESRSLTLKVATLLKTSLTSVFVK